MSNHLTVVDLQDGNRHMLPCIREDAGHAELLGDDA
jgi:hypothetical protein